MEKEIFKVLAKYKPFSILEIEWIYNKLHKSFDMTILAMRMSCLHNISLQQSAEVILGI